MARLPRLTVAGYPHHIVQRGNNRQPIVLDDGDRRQLLAHLQFCARQARVAIHAYVLMDNHLHLLLTPETDTGAPRMMQALGRAYVRYFNTRHGRSGTLWEGRYRCSVIEAETHLLPCMAYLALNPVRAGLASRAADYPWSSHAHLAGLRTDPLITRHPLYWALGNTPFAREAAYAALVEAAIGTTAEHTALGRAVHGNWALGSAAFMAALAQKTPRRAQQAPRGRPRKRAANHGGDHDDEAKPGFKSGKAIFISTRFNQGKGIYDDVLTEKHGIHPLCGDNLRQRMGTAKP